MRTILFIIRKEFLQIFRNRSMLPIIFVMPVIQLLILSNAATYEVKNVRLEIIDMDQSNYSRQLIGKFQAFEYFKITDVTFSEKKAKTDLQEGNADIVIQIPANFERDLVKNQKNKVLIAIDAIDGAAAAVINGYATAILADFNQAVQVEWLGTDFRKQQPTIDVTQSFWYNPELKYTTFMVPGILVLLVTMVALFLAGMNIVREKEIGTIEQINVTPIKKYQFIIGKLFPFWLLGLFELGIGLILGVLIFNIPIVGSIFTIYLFASVYLLVVLGMGLFISTFTDTQQQAMFLSWFFMVIFILMSGLFTPIESMPGWAQVITQFNPIRYFVEVMRMVMLKGAGFYEIRQHLAILVGYALAMNILAIRNYRKTAS